MIINFLTNVSGALNSWDCPKWSKADKEWTTVDSLEVLKIYRIKHNYVDAR